MPNDRSWISATCIECGALNWVDMGPVETDDGRADVGGFLCWFCGYKNYFLLDGDDVLNEMVMEEDNVVRGQHFKEITDA